MRPGSRVVNFMLFTLAIVLSKSTVSAQTLTPCMHQVPINMMREIFSLTRSNARPAYTATVKQTFEQSMVDGNTIHWTVEEVQARDEAGRTMRQYIQGCEVGNDGQPQLRIQTTVYDPVSKTNTSWATGPGTTALANLMHQPQPAIPPDWKDIPRTPAAPYRPQMTREQLGTRTIAGMEATGTRITQIIPAGDEGNDMPLKFVSETWMNSQNHATLLVIDDDPRTGHRTWEVESLTAGPPDPALFAPPTNYKVWDQNPQPQTTAGTNR